MQDKTIQIAMIGAGETGTPLLKQLLTADFVNVLTIADLDDNAVGMKLARQHGVATTNDFMNIAKMGEKIDIIIDVTGVAKVREQLRHYLYDNGNHHTVIMHERIAILLMSLIEGKLVDMKHGDIEYD